MSKMTDSELRSLLESEKRDALSAQQASKLSTERAQALDFYNGDMSNDMPSMDGRSSAVSSDVLDTVEGLMPILMDIFTGGDEVVRFEPHGPEDVKPAEQETDYVNYVFMQKNAGFMTLYSMIKDALLQKTGLVKVWTETEEKETKETYTDQPPDSFAMLVDNPELEMTEHTEHDGLHDATFVNRKQIKRHKVMAMPPEEFGISRYARSIKDAGYVFHETPRSVSSLIAEGYDAEQLKAIPTYINAQNIEELARDTVDENMWAGGSSGNNEANRMVRVTEHHIRCDYDGSGKSKLYRVTTAGEQGDILTKDGKLDIVETNRIKMAAITPYVVTHRFFGKSVADQVIDIQKIKTALLRGMLDNTYLAINPRAEIAESFATETTLDDFLTMRPGMPIRTKMPGGIVWQQTPFVGGEILPVMQFVDATREWRTGVSRQGQGVDPNALQNQVATIANQMQAMSDMKVKLIARIFAETGIRDLFALLHAEIRENGDQAQIVRLRNEWVPVDPRDWKERDDMTINVGLGTGSKAEQLAMVQLIIGAQEKAIQAGMVSPNNLYSSAKDLLRLAGRKDVESYFTQPGKPADPNNPASNPITPPPDPKMQEIQLKAQIETLQAQADITTQDRKTQAEIALQNTKTQSDMALAKQEFDLDAQLKLLDAQIKREQHQADMSRDAAKHAIDIRGKSIDANIKLAERGQKADDNGEPALHPIVNDAVKTLTDRMDGMDARHEQMMKLLIAPRKSTLHRDPTTGRPTHATHEIDMGPMQ